MPKIKNHRNRNQYLLTESGLWVRNFNSTASPVDINQLIRRDEFSLLIENENKLLDLRIPELSRDNIPKISKAVIISDGFGFDEVYPYLEQLPADVTIIGVNRSLAKWKVVNGIVKRRMDYYFVNNPFPECMAYLPTHPYRPKLLTSIRTHPAFIKKFQGSIRYSYSPTPSLQFGTRRKHGCVLDDYRNSICAAISFLNFCGVSKLSLLCCDDVLPEYRPAAEKIPNGKWIYPQHRISHELIDGVLYWLTHQEDRQVSVSHYSYGLDYNNSEYIVLKDFLQDMM